MERFDPKRDYIERCMTNTPLGIGAFGRAVLGHDTDHPKKFLIKKIELTRRLDKAAFEKLRSCVELQMSVRVCMFPPPILVTTQDWL